MSIFRQYGLDRTEREKRRLYWRDTMEGTTCKWTPNVSLAPGSAVSYVANEIDAFEGDKVLKIVTAAGTHSAAYQWLSKFPDKKISVELRWYIPTTEFSIYFQFYRWDGSYRYEAEINYRSSNYIWYIKTNADLGTYENFLTRNANGPFGPGGGDYTWNYFKAIYNLESMKYDKLILNDTLLTGIDLSAYTIDGTASTTLPSTGFQLEFTTAANNTPMYFDDARIYFYED